MPEEAWTKLALDFAGPFELLPHCEHYLIALIDYRSKWVDFDFCESPNSHLVSNFLSRVFKSEGPPKEIVTDNGSHFCSSTTQEFFSMHAIKYLKVALYSPSSNGLIERMNRFIKEGIQKALASNVPVEPFLRKNIWSYLVTPHSTTSISPFRLLKKRDPNNDICPTRIKLVKSKDISCLACHDRLLMQNNVTTQQEVQTKHFNAHITSDSHNFCIGDWVLIRNPRKVTKGSS